MKRAADKGTKKLQVLGDSKLLMDWTNGKCKITNMALGPTMNRVLDVKNHFDSISFTHLQGIQHKSRLSS